MLSANEIIAILTEKFGSKITASFGENKYPRIHVNVENWREIAEFILRDPRLKLDWLANHTGIDYVADDKMCVAHDLYSFDLKHTFAVKVYAPRGNPVFPTVCDLWPAADWHEREAYDLLGITFTNHPDLRRILCSDDWVGFPLRKDYVFPREYHGIPASVELDWQQQPDYPG